MKVDAGIPTPEEFTEQLVADTKDAALIEACIKRYSKEYHIICELVMNGNLDEARERRNKLLE